MEPKSFRKREGPEAPIKRAIVAMLEAEKWYVIVTHGNEFVSGLPDLYCCHLNHGVRWIEVKNPEKYSFTRDQMRVFPELAARGVGIWVLTAATPEQYRRLWKPANYHRYIGHTNEGKIWS